TAPNGIIVHGEFEARHGFRGFRDYGLAIPRLLLDHVLLDCARAAGARVCEGVVVRDVAVDGNGRGVGGTAQAGTAAGRTFRGQVVVGADGLRSVVARRSQLGRHGRWPRRVSLVTHFRGVEGIDECGEMHVAPHGYVGLADVGHGLTNVALVVPASRAR